MIVYFRLWPAFSPLHSILRQLHRITTQWPWTLCTRSDATNICVISVVVSRISLRFALRPAAFQTVTRYRSRHPSNVLGMVLNTKLSMAPCRHLYFLPMGSNFLSVRVTLEIQCCGKSEMYLIISEWPWRRLNWTLNGRMYPPYILNADPWGPTSPFQGLGIFIFRHWLPC